MNSSQKRENWIIYACLAALIFGFYALKTDLSIFGENKYQNTENRIASVVKVNSDARVRTPQNMFWQTLDRKDLIAQGDSLFVGPNSSVTIKFTDGKSVTISENSLIKFQKENEKVKLNLQYGKLKSQDLPQEIVLDDCGQSVKIQTQNSGGVEIGKSNNCGKLEVKAVKGDIKVNDKIVKKSEPAVQILKPKTVVLNEKPKVNVAMAKIEELKISNFDNLANEKDAAEKAQKELAAELARKQAEELLQAQKAEEEARLKAEQERLAAEEEQRKKEEAEKLLAEQQEAERLQQIIKNLKPPVILKPKQQYAVASQKPPQALWAKVENAEEYIIETSDSPKFEKIQTTQHTKNLNQTLNFSKDNTVYYRLKTVGPKNSLSTYSNVGVIEGIFDKIKFAKNNIQLNYYPKSSREPASIHQVPIQWTPLKQAAKYKVYLDTNDQFKTAKSFETENNNYTLPVETEGKYFSKVEAFDTKNQLISLTDQPAEISINKVFDLSTPTLDKSLKKMTYYFQKSEAKFIWLKWTPTPSTQKIKYRIEIANDKSFSQVYKAYLTTNAKILLKNQVPSGSYYWRVRTENASATTPQYSDWSESAYLQIINTK